MGRRWFRRDAWRLLNRTRILRGVKPRNTWAATRLWKTHPRLFVRQIDQLTGVGRCGSCRPGPEEASTTAREARWRRSRANRVSSTGERGDTAVKGVFRRVCPRTPIIVQTPFTEPDGGSRPPERFRCPVSPEGPPAQAFGPPRIVGSRFAIREPSRSARATGRSTDRPGVSPGPAGRMTAPAAGSAWPRERFQRGCLPAPRGLSLWRARSVRT